MKKVIIIGAGPAGITAGYELMKQSDEYEVTILEETPYIGGISRTEVYNGHRMDIGGHRFFSKSQEVNEWWEKIMPMQGAPAYDDDKIGRTVPLATGGPDPSKTDRVMLNRSRISHIYYKRKFFEYPVKMNMDTVKNMGFGTTLQAGFSYLGSMIAKKPQNSLENFYINQFGKKLYSMFFEGYTEKLWGRHPREIDPSWGAQRTKGLSITEIVKDATRKALHKEVKDVNTSLISAFKYPKLGPGQLWEAAAADFEAMGGSIHLNCRVIRINTNGNKVESVTCAVDGITIEETADIVISSMPVKDLIIGMSNVPYNVTEIARKLPYRDFVTVGLLVPKLRINNTTYMKTLGNVIPDTWIYVQDTGVKMGRIQIFNNWSPYLLENPEKTVWVGLEYFCNEGDRYWNMTDEEWIQFATKELVQMGILSESTKVLDAHKVAVKKAYPAYFDSYSQFEDVRTYLDSFDNLYCVGRNGQHRYNNMDHSMITSFEAVKNIISGKKDKSNIWSVNTEQEYHEEKKEEKKQEEVVKTTPGAAPVPPVKELPKADTPVVAQPVNNVPVKAEVKVQQEEELQATVQPVPAPPVRKQLRRNPLPKAVEETVTDNKPVEAAVVAMTVPAEVQVSSAETVSTQNADVVVPEAEIHVSKSRSIWDDVAYAEATSEVKTAPIRFKSVEEAHAAVKGAAMDKSSEEKVADSAKAVAEVKETTQDENKTEKKSADTAEKTEEKKPAKSGRKKKVVSEETVKDEKTVVAESDTAEEKAKTAETEATQEVKKPARSRKKKSVEADVVEADAKTEEKGVEAKEAPAEEKQEEVAETVKTEKKPNRSRRKKPVETETAETTSKEESVKETVQAEESKEELAKEAVRAEESKEELAKEAVQVEEPAEENSKPEENKEDSVKEIEKEEVKETPEEEKNAESTESIKAEEKKPTRSRRKKPAETENKEIVKTEEVVTETVKKEVTVKEPDKGADKKEETQKEETVKEDVKKEEVHREVASHSRSTSGKTIAGRSSSHRSSANRHNAGKRKVESKNGHVSSVGKEAVVGNLKGTVIKANVIEKTAEIGKKK